jgi:hypothetical protein
MFDAQSAISKKVDIKRQILQNYALFTKKQVGAKFIGQSQTHY